MQIENSNQKLHSETRRLEASPASSSGEKAPEEEAGPASKRGASEYSPDWSFLFASSI